MSERFNPFDDSIQAQPKKPRNFKQNVRPAFNKSGFGNFPITEASSQSMRELFHSRGRGGNMPRGFHQGRGERNQPSIGRPETSTLTYSSGNPSYFDPFNDQQTKMQYSKNKNRQQPGKKKVKYVPKNQMLNQEMGENENSGYSPGYQSNTMDIDENQIAPAKKEKTLSRCIIVKNINQQNPFTEEILRQHFGKFGEIQSCALNEKNRKNAYLTFSSHSEATSAKNNGQFNNAKQRIYNIFYDNETKFVSNKSNLFHTPSKQQQEGIINKQKITPTFNFPSELPSTNKQASQFSETFQNQSAPKNNNWRRTNLFSNPQKAQATENVLKKTIGPNLDQRLSEPLEIEEEKLPQKPQSAFLPSKLDSIPKLTDSKDSMSIKTFPIQQITVAPLKSTQSKKNKSAFLSENAKCMTKCSEKECEEREKYNDLSLFEIDPKFYDPNAPINNNEGRYKAKREWCVKKYIRSAADRIMNDPQIIRPPQVLAETMDYLLNEILDADKAHDSKFIKANVEFEDIYTFVNDRFRAIRQDFTILDFATDKYCIQLHEQICRFHLLCINECVEWESFSYRQNMEQLTASLTSLRQFYSASRKQIYKNRLKDHPPNTNPEDLYQSPNESEFYAYSILIQIDEENVVSQLIQNIPEELLALPELKYALKLMSVYRHNNFVRFFKMIKKSPFLIGCCLCNTFLGIRKKALASLSTSFRLSKFEIRELKELLLMNSNAETIKFILWANASSMIESLKELLNFPDKEQGAVPIEIKYKEHSSGNPWKTTTNLIIHNKLQGQFGKQKKRADIIRFQILKGLLSSDISLPGTDRLSNEVALAWEKKINQEKKRVETPPKIKDYTEPMSIPNLSLNLSRNESTYSVEMIPLSRMQSQIIRTPSQSSPMDLQKDNEEKKRQELLQKKQKQKEEKIRRLKELRKELKEALKIKKRMQQKRKRNNLCILVFRFSVWKKFVRIMKQQRFYSENPFLKMREKSNLALELLQKRIISSIFSATAYIPEIRYEANISDYLISILEDSDIENIEHLWFKFSLSVNLTNPKINCLINWILAKMTKGQFTLDQLKYPMTCIFDETIPFWVNQSPKTLKFCIDLLYEVGNEQFGEFYCNDYSLIQGSSVLLFIMNKSIEQDFQRFRKVMKNIAENGMIGIIFLYCSELKDSDYFEIENGSIADKFELEKLKQLKSISYFKIFKIPGLSLEAIKIYNQHNHFEYPLPKQTILSYNIQKAFIKAILASNIILNLDYIELHSAFNNISELKEIQSALCYSVEFENLSKDSPHKTILLQKIMKSKVKSINYLISFFNAIVDQITINIENAIKQRSRLIPEFMENQEIQILKKSFEDTENCSEIIRKMYFPNFTLMNDDYDNISAIPNIFQKNLNFETQKQSMKKLIQDLTAHLKSNFYWTQNDEESFNNQVNLIIKGNEISFWKIYFLIFEWKIYYLQNYKFKQFYPRQFIHTMNYEEIVKNGRSLNNELSKASKLKQQRHNLKFSNKCFHSKKDYKRLKKKIDQSSFTSRAIKDAKPVLIKTPELHQKRKIGDLNYELINQFSQHLKRRQKSLNEEPVLNSYSEYKFKIVDKPTQRIVTMSNGKIIDLEKLREAKKENEQILNQMESAIETMNYDVIDIN